MFRFESNTQAILTGEQIHIVPATFKGENIKNGCVSNYFGRTIKEEGEHKTAILQGHTLKGTTQNCQNVYKCFLLKEGETTQLIAMKKIPTVTEWRKDQVWGKGQGHIGIAEKYIQLQNILHDEEINMQ